MDKVDGITGVTPVWRPVSNEIKEIVKDLQKLSNDNDALTKFKINATIWDRSIKSIPTSSEDDEFNVDYSLPQTSIEQGQGDLIFKCWKFIGFGELGLIVLGVIIVLITSIKRQSDT